MSIRVASSVRTALIVAAVIVGILAVILVALWFTVLPRALATLGAEPAAAGTEVTLVAGEQSVTVAVPEEWIVQRPPFHPDTVIVLTPDVRLEATIVARDDPPDAAFADLAAREDLGSPLRERVAGGLLAVHAEADDLLVVAVGMPDAPPAATVVARVPSGSVDQYRLAIAQLIDGVRMGP